jgi:mono/diheme cytochrome c family protein
MYVGEYLIVIQLRMIRLLFTAVIMLYSVHTAGALDAAAQRGLQFSEENCGSCHAIDRISESPVPTAPAFRDLYALYPVDSIGQAFAEGFVSSHPMMPQFQLEADQVSDLIAYLQSIGVDALSPTARRGFEFAQENCQTCHAIGRIGESPAAGAPAFRDLYALYPVDSLRPAFAEGFVSGHPSMPQFQLEPDQISGLIAYLRSVGVDALSPAARRGFEFAQANCQGCHAIGRIGDSPTSTAPAFRDLRTLYQTESLEGALTDGLASNHPTMPQLELDSWTIRNLTTYLESLD